MLSHPLRLPFQLCRGMWENRSELLLAVLLHGHFGVAIVALILVVGCNGRPVFSGPPDFISDGFLLALAASCLLSVIDRMYEQEKRAIFATSAVMHVVVVLGAFAQTCYLGVTVDNAPPVCTWIYNGAVTLYTVGFAIVAGSAVLAVFTPDHKPKG